MHHVLRELAGDFFVLLILVTAGLVISIKTFPEWFRRVSSAHWPTVSGTVEGGNVSTFRSRGRYLDRSVEVAIATISYSYRFGGGYYSGYHTKSFNDEQRAWSYVDALKGAAVNVSYNPRKPEVSVLRSQPILIQP